MRNYNSDYGNQAAPVVAGDYPYGRPDNSSVTGALNGFPYDEKFLRDIVGFLSALITEMGLTPSGTEESATSSQLLAALRILAGITGGTAGNLPEIASGKLIPSSTPNPAQDLRSSGSPTFADATIASKLLSTYLAYLNQDVKTTASPTFATVNTGQGANELYAMNQNVRTSDQVFFYNLNLSGYANITDYLALYGEILPMITPIISSFSISAGSTQIVPRGIYIFRWGGTSLEIQGNFSGGWFRFSGDGTDSFGGVVISDGINIRISNSSGVTVSQGYIKY